MNHAICSTDDLETNTVFQSESLIANISTFGFSFRFFFLPGFRFINLSEVGLGMQNVSGSSLHRLSGLDIIFVIIERQTFHREDWELCNGRRERQNIIPSGRGEWGVGRLASHIATQPRQVPRNLTFVDHSTRYQAPVIYTPSK